MKIIISIIRFFINEIIYPIANCCVCLWEKAINLQDEIAYEWKDMIERLFRR